MILLLIFAIAFAVPIIYHFAKEITHWFLSFFLLFCLVYVIPFENQLKNGPIYLKYEWFPSLNIFLEIYIDGLSFIFAILILFIGSLIIIYSGVYLKDKDNLSRFYTYILMFAGSMLGIVVSGNLIMIFIFWELTSVSSFFLIGYYNKKEASIIAAQQALIVTAFGGLALLAGFVIIYLLTGTFSLKELSAHRETIIFSNFYLPLLFLILVGAFTKSAQMPFHFWLPNAMIAPAPVSAYLHSATMVKAGIFLLMRLFPILGDTDLWKYTLIFVGMTTMLFAAFISAKRTDLKQILAFSTISSLGAMVVLIGIGSKYAIQAAVIYFLAHALYKASLFLSAGVIEHYTHTRNIETLKGLYKTAPIFAIIALTAALSQSGIPPFFGYFAKEISYKAVVQSDFIVWVLSIVFLITNIFLICSAFLVGFKPFAGSYEKKKIVIKPLFLVSPFILSTLGFISSLFPSSINDSIINPAISGVMGVKVNLDISFWPGFSWPLLLSIFTFIGGYYAYRYRQYFRLQTEEFVKYLKPSLLYNYTIDFLKNIAVLQTRFLQSGYLRNYILIIILFTLFIISFPIFFQSDIVRVFDNISEWFYNFDFIFYEFILYFIIVIAALTIPILKSRIFAIILLGVVGYGISAIFFIYGAPDLAMTQFAIETLTVIIFVLVIFRLPKFSAYSQKKTILRDIFVSAICGAVFVMFIFLISYIEPSKFTSKFYSENSLLLAQGRNIVNVILVDFRALDTLVEVTVLLTACFGIYALMKLGGNKHIDSISSKSELKTTYNHSVNSNSNLHSYYSVLLVTATKLIIPLLLIFSIFLLFRGHNQPGGGFVGGLVASSVFAILALAENSEKARTTLKFSPETIIGFGFAIILISTFIPLLFGYSFMQGVWFDLYIPVVQKIGTPFLFDVGIYFLVTGVILKSVFSIMEN
ncbi:MAG: Na+/H+ antiporter subunit B [Ignavibacteria bacterium]|nr:Na+/H+ antiporter subunit B [Ignavibacteria bacterium]